VEKEVDNRKKERRAYSSYDWEKKRGEGRDHYL